MVCSEVSARDFWLPTQWRQFHRVAGARQAWRLHWVRSRISPTLCPTTEAICRYPDKVRGVLNEGGLYGERQGWHLPGFDTTNWTGRDLSEGLPGAGVGFFVTTVDLSLPDGTDAAISFQYDTTNTTYRALLFVNGWNYGKVCTDRTYLTPCLTVDRVACSQHGSADEVPCSAGHLGPQWHEVSTKCRSSRWVRF